MTVNICGAATRDATTLDMAAPCMAGPVKEVAAATM